MKRVMALTGLILFVFTIGYANIIYAGSHHSGKHAHGERGVFNEKRVMKRLSKLDLTEQQYNDILALVKTGFETSKPLKGSLEEMHQRMKALKNAESIDEVAIRSLATEMSNVKSDLTIIHLNKRKQIAAMLTEEQRTKLETMKRKHKKRHSH